MEVVAHQSLAELIRRQKAEQDAYLARNLQIIVLAVQGWTAPAIGMAVNLSRRVVQRHVAAYNAQGLDGLDDHRGAPERPLFNETEQAAFVDRVEQGPQPDDGVCTLRGRDFRRILRDEFGQWRSLTTIYRLLHQLGYSCLKPRPRHERSDPAKQAEFIRELPNRLSQVAAAHPGKKLRVYFEDEARFGQQGTLTKVWAKTGSRPTAVRQTAYQSTWVFAAACPETGLVERLICPKLNTSSVNAFLSQFSKRLAADEQAVMIWDGAGFHRGKKLKMPTNITPVTLPPYSPELNPVENLWHYLRSHHWSNRAYADAGELESAVIDAWRRSVLNPELMKTVCSDEIYRSQRATNR